MTHSTARPYARLLVYAAILAAIVVYWPGLKGPFLLDDLPNLSPLQRWLDGQSSALELIFGNNSGILGRPVSMASLWASAASGGMHPFPFKLGNLLIHVVCGLVGWKMLAALLAEDPRLAPRANLTGAVLAGLWLIHPINVSTVLYAVQRMAQLSTLFALAAVWIYVVARRQLADQKSSRSALLMLFVLFPLVLVAGLFSKENAAVIPALCLVVELAYFSRQQSGRRTVAAFYGIFLVVPLLAATAIALLTPDKLFGLYATRDFTLIERLLSQPRALFEYLGLLFWPRTGQMGIYVDDFAFSTGILSPPTTLLAILGLLAISGLAISVRRYAPSVFAGWFFFLVAHGVESTVLPLELYFEHRNYLPAFGILLAVAGMVAWATKGLGFSSMRLRKGSALLTGAFAISLAALTAQQALVWRSAESIVLQAIEHRPDSMRAKLEMLTLAVRDKQWNKATAVISDLTSSDNPREKLLGHINAVTVDCLRGAGGDPANLRQAEDVEIEWVTLADAQALTPLSLAMANGYCGQDISEAVVADSIVRILDQVSQQSDLTQPKWLMRTTATDLYMRAGRWKDAQDQGELAWQPSVSNTAIGGLLVRIYIHNGERVLAQRTLDQIRSRTVQYELNAVKAAEQLQAQIDKMPH